MKGALLNHTLTIIIRELVRDLQIQNGMMGIGIMVYSFLMYGVDDRQRCSEGYTRADTCWAPNPPCVDQVDVDLMLFDLVTEQLCITEGMKWEIRRAKSHREGWNKGIIVGLSNINFGGVTCANAKSTSVSLECTSFN